MITVTDLFVWFMPQQFYCNFHVDKISVECEDKSFSFFFFVFFFSFFFLFVFEDTVVTCCKDVS
jgi:hypothetical protein